MYMYTYIYIYQYVYTYVYICIYMYTYKVAWLVYTCDMTHWHVWHDFKIYHSHTCHDSSISVTWTIQICDMNNSNLWHDQFISDSYTQKNQKKGTRQLGSVSPGARSKLQHEDADLETLGKVRIIRMCDAKNSCMCQKRRINM